MAAEKGRTIQPVHPRNTSACRAPVRARAPTHSVIPAQAGTQGSKAQSQPLWVPAFAGMTIESTPAPLRTRGPIAHIFPLAEKVLACARTRNLLLPRSPAKVGAHSWKCPPGSEGPCFRRNARAAPTRAQAAPAERTCPTCSRPSSEPGCRTDPPKPPPEDARRWCGRG